MKKLIINIIAIAGILITILATGCSVRYHQNHGYRYGDRYHHYQYENDRYYSDGDRHPRRY